MVTAYELAFEPERFFGGDGGPCTTPRPDEIVGCRSVDEQTAHYCKSPTRTCPAIAELWTSRKVVGVPFDEGCDWEPVTTPGVARRYAVRRITAPNAALDMTPAAWGALAAFVTLMRTVGLPIKSIITDGAHVCRCWKVPEGVCKRDGTGCTSDGLSDHALGNAVDILGVKWQDPAAVGSSLRATLERSWNDDPPEQSALIVRINACLRLAFTTVLDYARGDSHRWHFHCETSKRTTWKRNGTPNEVCEAYFIWGALKRLGIVARTPANKKVTWDKARAGLAAFAQQQNLTAPTSTTPDDWRPVVDRLLWCTATGTC